jgi:hypothetical protein
VCVLVRRRDRDRVRVRGEAPLPCAVPHPHSSNHNRPPQSHAPPVLPPSPRHSPGAGDVAAALDLQRVALDADAAQLNGPPAPAAAVAAAVGLLHPARTRRWQQGHHRSRAPACPLGLPWSHELVGGAAACGRLAAAATLGEAEDGEARSLADDPPHRHSHGIVVHLPPMVFHRGRSPCYRNPPPPPTRRRVPSPPHPAGSYASRRCSLALSPTPLEMIYHQRR